MLGNLPKYSVLVLLFLGGWMGVAEHTNAQVTLGSLPVSWTVDDDLSDEVNFLSSGSVDVEALLDEDEETELNARSGPMRFATRKAVDYTPDNAGRWTTLSNGDRIWMLGIESDGALAIGLTFGKFHIPRGAALYLYNPERTDVIGALTSTSNHANKVLTTESIAGDRLILEYYEPYAVRHQGQLRIRTVAHTYRNVNYDSIEETCSIQPACSGEKRMMDLGTSVVRMTVDDGTRHCTATLVNNANFDGKPYLITNASALIGDPNGWHFTFRKANAACQTSPVQRDTYSLSGASLRATDPNSGLALIELHSRPLPEWGVYYAGWDATESTPQSASTIHHPFGNVKEIAMSSESPVPTAFNSVLSYRIDGWTEGRTAEASTGAPLITSQFLVKGAMVAGFSTCGTDAPDYFSALSNAWPMFSNFLDPFGEGTTMLNGTYLNFSTVDRRLLDDNIAVFPVPATTHLTLVNEGDEAIDEVAIYDLSGREVYRNAYFGNQVSIDALPVGHFILAIFMGNEVVRKPFVKWNP